MSSPPCSTWTATANDNVSAPCLTGPRSARSMSTLDIRVSGSPGAAPNFTPTQGQYLAFIYAYTRLNGRPPAESDMQRYFKVSPPSVHQMVLTLERLGLIRRQAGVSRSIELLVAPEDLPILR